MRIWKRRLSACVVLVLAVLTAALPSVLAEQFKLPNAFNYRGDVERIPGEVELTLKAGKYRFVADKTGEETVVMEDCGLATTPGEPQLPVRMVDAALPPNIDWESITIVSTVTETEEIPGRHAIRPAPVPKPVAGEEFVQPSIRGRILETRVKAVFERNALYPLEPVRLAGGGQMRKWRFARLAFTPVQYNPVEKKLILLKQVQVKLRFKRIGRQVFQTDHLLKDDLMDAEARTRLVNFAQAREWYRYVPAPGPAPQPLPGTAEYAVVTTNAIRDGSTVLNDFVAHKMSQGHTVRVVTEDDYDALTGQAPNGRAEKIRQWLIDNYVSLGIKWVLLIGNPDPDDPASPTDSVGDVPMKMCWPNCLSTIYRESPTDYFFADLTGNWDLDGDGFFGEDAGSWVAATPDPAVNPETYSVRWTGRIEAAAAGNHNFQVVSDEGIRVRIDGTTVADNWTPHFLTANYFTLSLTAGQHDIEIEFFNDHGDATAQLLWRQPGDTYYAAVPAARLYHLSGASYVSGGLTGQYFNNIDFTAPALTRVDPTVSFYWWTDDGGPGGVDFTPEVYVGRIPVYGGDYAGLDVILQKIIDYESVAVIPAWRRNALFGLAYLWDPGSDWELGEAILNDYAKELGFGFYRHYEENTGVTPEASPVIGHPPAFPPHPPDPDPAALDNMLKEWVNNNVHPGYGVVVWSTHGSSAGASGLMSSALCTHLDDARPAFVFQGSCLNGYPESANNLGYALLRQGAIGTVSASRVSWSYCFSPPANPNSGANCDLSYFYNRRLMNGEPAGRALYRTKDAVSHDWDWMNKMDFNLYGDPTTALFEPYVVADADLVPVLDISGSMSMYASSANTDRKIDVLRQAADQLVDMLDADAGHQFGLVKFSTTATTAMNLQPFTAASRAAAHAQIGALGPTNLTSIGGGLSKALTEFATHGAAGHRRIVLLVTDGMENTAPMIAGIKPGLVAGNVTVYPLGLGYSYGVDEARLIDLADSTGGDYRITDDDLIFRKYFLEVLGSATDWSVVTDPVLTLSGGQTQTVPVAVTPSDTAAIFTVYWSGTDNAVKLTLQAPDGSVYDQVSPTYRGSKRYAFYRIDLEKAPPARRNGVWSMRIQADAAALGGRQVRFAASALAKSGTKIRVSSSSSFARTGEGVLLKVRLTQNGRPITGASVTVHYEKPAVGIGNVLRVQKVEPAVLRTTRTDLTTPLQLKVDYLQKKLGRDFLPRKTGRFTLRDDGTQGDARADDGVYSYVFTDTAIPGSYAFRFVAAGVAAGEARTTREWSCHLQNSVAIAPEFSKIEVKVVQKTSQGVKYSVQVTPRDRFGNYLGPGHTIEVNLGGRRVSLHDNLDGGYTGEIFLTAAELRAGKKPGIRVDGVMFTQLRF